MATALAAATVQVEGQAPLAGMEAAVAVVRVLGMG